MSLTVVSSRETTHPALQFGPSELGREHNRCSILSGREPRVTRPNPGHEIRYPDIHRLDFILKLNNRSAHEMYVIYSHIDPEVRT